MAPGRARTRPAPGPSGERSRWLAHAAAANSLYWLMLICSMQWTTEGAYAERPGAYGVALAVILLSLLAWVFQAGWVFAMLAIFYLLLPMPLAAAGLLYLLPAFVQAAAADGDGLGRLGGSTLLILGFLWCGFVTWRAAVAR